MHQKRNYERMFSVLYFHISFFCITIYKSEDTMMMKTYKDKQPQLHESCYVADNATIVGDVTLKKGSSVWFHSVIRGDKDKIVIGENSNIQDNCTLHIDAGYGIDIGKHVTIGHNAIVHGAKIEDEVLIGMGAILLNGVHIEKHCIVGAGAVVKEHTTIPQGSLVVGCPAKVIKQIDQDAIHNIVKNAQLYVALANDYKKMEE